ncbi:MAG: dTDP-4-dehydrorhamnose reductase [Steroidobacteraceae bacterium]|nr:dTDP-4-dehydrorhamnose reductase [Steroidobacteraceae bacterium]
MTGASGQLGWELQRTVPDSVELFAKSHAELDICDEQSVARAFRLHSPELVVNTAAFTDVDRAEHSRDLAFAINAEGPRLIARQAADAGGRMIQVSTDYVFAGDGNTPILPTARTAPNSAYGRSKLAGEKHVLQLLGTQCAVVRTAWLYSRHGRNFVKTMLGLMRSRTNLGVVSDQLGSPTWARELARSIWAFAARADLHGVYHWTDDGVASWYDFAVAIRDNGLERGLLKRRVVIDPIPAAAYPTAARRPRYSVLDKRSTIDVLGVSPNHWQTNLSHMLDDLANA